MKIRHIQLSISGVRVIAKNSTSVRGFWLFFLISGAAVLLGPIAAMAQIQDNSTPEVALEGSAVSASNSDERRAVVDVSAPQLSPTAPEVNSAVDRALPNTNTAAESPLATAPKVTGAIRELPPKELETANSPQSQTVAEVGTVADTSSETGTADDLSIQEDVAQVTSVSQLSDGLKIN